MMYERAVLFGGNTGHLQWNAFEEDHRAEKQLGPRIEGKETAGENKTRSTGA